jgi:hypothetical protein
LVPWANRAADKRTIVAIIFIEEFRIQSFE